MRDKMMSFSRKNIASVIAILLLATFAGYASAGTPTLSLILPRGVQRGTDAELVFQGARLEDAKEVFIYTPGITVKSLEIKSPTELHAHITINKDARIGEYCARVRTETGISELRTFYVTPFPVIEIKPADPKKPMPLDFEHPEPINLNVTVAGKLENEQVQFFGVDMKKGQRLTAEVHGMRLGDVLDPYLAILDEKRFELAVSDDTALAMQDSIASCIIPADGRYIVLLRESSYGAGNRYLLHVGTFPRPHIVYPLGGRPGEDLAFQYLGDVEGPMSQTIKLPNQPVESLDVFATQDGLSAPSPNRMRVSDMPNVLEKEPNDDFKTATRYEGELPVAFNGIIEKAGDVDFFSFKAKKGQSLDVRVIARALRSPLDSVLAIHNPTGATMDRNDDSGGPDSYLRFNVPEDGVYGISVTDQLGQGGPDYAYRVEITPIKPALVFTIPSYAQNSQERWTVPVPRGNRYATLVRAVRTNFGGEVSMSMSNLPDGVTMQAPNQGDGTDVVPVVFEARADAPLEGKLAEVTGVSVPQDAKSKPVDVHGHYEQKVELVYGNNNQPLYQTRVDTLAVAVTREAPFKLHLEQPKVPLVQGGSMELKVTAERAPDFKAPIQVRLLFTPPNIGAVSAMDMPGDKSEVLYPLNAQQNAALRGWKICMVGMADVQGQLWVSSELINLEVAAPFVLASSNISAVEQGKPGAVLFKLDQKLPFDGQAKCKLMGLPPNVTADDVEINASAKEVTFPITVGDKAPVGSHKSVYCRLTIMKDGEPMIHNIGQGATLRVDKVEVAVKPPAPAPVAEAKPAPKPSETPRVLSRLEKLREEQGSK